MPTLENKNFLRDYFEALSGKEKPTSVVEKYVTDEELKHHIALFEAAFPKYELVAEDMVAEEEKVAIRVTFRGTHLGELMGIAPTYKEVTASGMLIYRIIEGKIVEHWMSFDQLSLMQQLGVIPTPEPAAG